MATFITGTTFTTNQQVTATSLNNVVNNATFASGAVTSGGGLSISSGGASLFVTDGGIVASKLGSDSVTTVKIMDANVTPAKLSAGAPTWSSSTVTIPSSLDFSAISTTATAGTYGRSGNTVTITMSGHNMTDGMVADLTFVAGTGGAATSGSYPITFISNTQFSIIDSTSGTITGSPACSRTAYYGNSTVRGSQTVAGNLSVTGNASVTGSLNIGGSTVRILTRGTVQNTTSGTSIDFTSIPSWVKRVTLILNGLSTNGTSMILFRLGTGGTPVTSGYTAAASNVGSNDNTSSSSDSTAGVPISGYAITVGATFYGNVVFTNISGNTWLCSGVVTGGTSVVMLAGSIALGGVLDILRITTAGGTAAFDAGSANILYE
jgi:hypothetical protein